MVDDPVADLDRPAGDAFQPRHHPQQRRLAATRGTDQHHELPVRDVDADAVQNLDGSERLRHVADRYFSHRPSPHSRREASRRDGNPQRRRRARSRALGRTWPIRVDLRHGLAGHTAGAFAETFLADGHLGGGDAQARHCRSDGGRGAMPVFLAGLTGCAGSQDHPGRNFVMKVGIYEPACPGGRHPPRRAQGRGQHGRARRGVGLRRWAR